MREAGNRRSPPVDSWIAFAIRCLAALAYMLISLFAGRYFDRSDSSISVRCAAVVIIVSGFTIAFIWTTMWIRRADEYQRLMNYRNLASAMAVTMLVFFLIHVAHAFDHPRDDGWSIMMMPAYAIFFAVMGSWPKKS